MLNIFGKNNILRRSNNQRLPNSFSETCIKYWRQISIWSILNLLRCVSLHFTNLYPHEGKSFKHTDYLKFYLLPKRLLLSCCQSYYDSHVQKAGIIFCYLQLCFCSACIGFCTEEEMRGFDESSLLQKIIDNERNLLFMHSKIMVNDKEIS